jgi:hypothetical protein
MINIPVRYNKYEKYFINIESRVIAEKKQFDMPRIYEYENILNIKYNLKELNLIKKKYQIIGGKNKKEIQYLIYNLLRFQYYIRKIIRTYRLYLLLKYKKLIGSRKYTNLEDFETLEPLKNIINLNILSLVDSIDENNNENVYGFHIKSYKKLLLKYKKKAFNPYTRKLIDERENERINSIMKINKLLNIPDDNINNEVIVLTNENKLKFEIHDLIHDINNLGNYADSMWIEKLDKNQIIKYIFELKDIWEYRANLTNQTKFQIYKFGNPFFDIPSNLLVSYSDGKLKKILITLMRRLISSEDNSIASLGAFYILGTLTLIEENSRNAMPWLYQSFYYTNI